MENVVAICPVVTSPDQFTGVDKKLDQFCKPNVHFIRQTIISAMVLAGSGYWYARLVIVKGAYGLKAE